MGQGSDSIGDDGYEGWDDFWEDRLPVVSHPPKQKAQKVKKFQYGAKVTKPCLYCRVDHEVRAADIRRGWGKFCSKSCKGYYQSAMLSCK